MIRNYNNITFSDADQYDAIISLIENSQKTRNYPIFSIENVIRDEGMLLFLLNQKKYIEPTRQKNRFGNIMYKLTRRGNNFILGGFFSNKGFLYQVNMFFTIFILPIIFIYSFEIIKKDLYIISHSEIDLKLNIYFIAIWIVYILYLVRNNRLKLNKNVIGFKEKYNLN